MFMVNDGGTSVQVYVLDTDCQVDEVIEAPVDPYDVEDLARASDGTLWLADIGDNTGSRDTVALHTLGADGTAALFRMTYPDGAHDAEALLLDPAGQPYLVTKDVFGDSGVYTPAGPLSPDEPTTLRRVGSVNLQPTGTGGGPAGALGQLLVTGAAMSPDGRLAVIRTYTDAYLYAVPDGDLSAALTEPPTRIALSPSRQGEAIAFAPNGRDLLLTSEGLPFEVTLLPAASDPAASDPAASDPGVPDVAGPGPVPAGAPSAGRSDVAGSLLLPAAGVGILGCLVGLGALVVHARKRRAG